MWHERELGCMSRRAALIAMVVGAVAPLASCGSEGVIGTTTTGDATLVTLALSVGSLTPAFSASTTSYTVAVPNSTTTVDITPIASNAGAVISVNGTTVVSGASTPIPLLVGANPISVLVTAPDGTAARTYSVLVTRAAGSGDPALSGLTISAGTLSPSFASATTSYTASVPNPTSILILTPRTADPLARITVNGTAVASGTTASVNLAVGTNTITVLVTSADGATTRAYVLVVNRAA